MLQCLFSVNYLDKASKLGCASLGPRCSQAAVTVQPLLAQPSWLWQEEGMSPKVLVVAPLFPQEGKCWALSSTTGFSCSIKALGTSD